MSTRRKGTSPSVLGKATRRTQQPSASKSVPDEIDRPVKIALSSHLVSFVFAADRWQSCCFFSPLELHSRSSGDVASVGV